MAMPQDLVGKIIKYTVPSFRTGTTLPTSGIVTDQTDTVALQLHDVIGLVGGPQGRQIKASPRVWNFTFLRYVPGYVTVAPITGPVLTGPMSGCYLCRYTEGNTRYLAHIGTKDSPDDPGTKAAKQTWKTFVARPEVSEVTGASPANLYTLAELMAVMPRGSAPPVVLGYFDPMGEAYAMAFSQVASNVQGAVLPVVLQISSVKKMTLDSWTSIAAQPRFA